MKPLQPSLPYGFLCTLSLAGPWTGVYPSLNWCLGLYDIKVSRPFPLGRGSPKQSLDSTSPTSTIMLIVLSRTSLKLSFMP
jgi:hypothetical protein